MTDDTISHTAGLVLAIASIGLFIGTLAAIPLVVRRLPEDYFVRPPRAHSLGMKVARNVIGATLVATGVAMLVLPGQGILTILLGASIMDLPIKHRLVRKMLEKPKIREGIQRLRAKVGRPPFVFPAHAS